MGLPHDEVIQTELLRLLARTPKGRMHCQEVYVILAKQFHRLTKDELTVPYRNSVSHWANRVQFARLHLVTKGWFLHSSMSGGRGYWAISEKGRTTITELEALGKKLLAELETM